MLGNYSLRMAIAHSPLISRGAAAFLQALIVILGLAALIFLLCEPQMEGVNAHATQFEIYFKDPLLAYVYVASIPVFTALVQAFKLLKLTQDNAAFSPTAVCALRTIKICALTVIAFVIGGEVFIFLHQSDDRAGGVFMGAVFAFGSVIVATAATILEAILQKALDLKSENDLTV